MPNQLPEFPNPFWRDSVDVPTFEKLNENINVDVAIVGGGITGITTAHLLVKEGYKIALIDADQILYGTTAHTTAKITTQHGLIYDELIQHMGKEKAKLYYQANDDALHFIRNMVDNNKIDCDLTKEDAYIFTNSDQKLNKLHKEAEAYKQLGINGEFIEDIPLDMDVKGAVKIKDQSQYHPLKYLTFLVKEIQKEGGHIFENTTAIDVEKGNEPKVITREGKVISSDYVISASHYPFHGGTGFYFSRMYAERSYIIAVKSNQKFPGGMYINAESPTRSIRYTYDQNGEQLILIAGERHKTGQGISENEHYKALESFAYDHVGVEEIKYRWSTQDLTTLDKVPYVGHLTDHDPNILVATGYRKWGMTNGTAAAILLRDIVTKKDSPYKDVYSPSRFYMDPSLKHFITENANVTKHLVKGKLEVPTKKAEELKNDEGSVVSLHGKRVGAYRDNEGELFMVNTTCNHMGCEVEWNSGDRTWDCPCHGSRYAIDGEVIEGPAKHPLSQIDQK